MKRILVNILFLLSANSIFSQNIIFDYPFTREDDKWNSYTSVQERLQAFLRYKYHRMGKRYIHRKRYY